MHLRFSFSHSSTQKPLLLPLRNQYCLARLYVRPHCVTSLPTSTRVFSKRLSTSRLSLMMCSLPPNVSHSAVATWEEELFTSWQQRKQAAHTFTRQAEIVSTGDGEWLSCVHQRQHGYIVATGFETKFSIHIFGFWATDGSLGWWKLITLVLRVCFPVNLWCHVSPVWVLPAAQKQISLVIISVLSDTTSLLCDIRSLYLILGAYSQNVEEVVTKS